MPGIPSLTIPTGRWALPFSSDHCSASTRFNRRLNSPCANHIRTSIRCSMAATVEPGPAVINSRRPASLYEVLRVKQNASPTEIKSAYRSLAKLYHPDSAVHGSESDGRDFIEIQNAYETLSDPSARELYDLSLVAAQGWRRRQFSSLGNLNRSPGFYPTRRWETDQCW